MRKRYGWCVVFCLLWGRPWVPRSSSSLWLTHGHKGEAAFCWTAVGSHAPCPSLAPCLPREKVTHFCKDGDNEIVLTFLSSVFSAREACCRPSVWARFLVRSLVASVRWDTRSRSRHRLGDRELLCGRLFPGADSAVTQAVLLGMPSASWQSSRGPYREAVCVFCPAGLCQCSTWAPAGGVCPPACRRKSGLGMKVTAKPSA